MLESDDGAVERRVKVGDGVGTEQEKVVVQCDDGVGLQDFISTIHPSFIRVDIPIQATIRSYSQSPSS